MQKVLLINPESTRKVYLETNVRAGAPMLPPLSLANLAGALKSAGHDVKMLDLDLADVSGESGDGKIEKSLIEFKPDITGITSVTPTWHAMLRAAERVKAALPETTVVCGGVHSTLFPKETLDSRGVDVVALGEADFALNELLDAGGDAAGARGMAFKRNGAVEYTAPRALIDDLDALPPPAWDLFDIHRYAMSRLTERRRPGGYLETSRGCPFDCVYCSKVISGRVFRAKSPRRVVVDIETMLLKHGFREIHIVDDGFTTDIGRAKEICELIIERELDLVFNLFNGIRADRVDDELMALLKRAGCWQVAFGIESGNPGVLKSVSKGLTKDKIRNAVALTKKHGMETFGFFMIGLPEDTEETIRETIRFAAELDLTISKFDVAVPLPGTRMFETLDREGMILTKDWRRYIFHRADEPLFSHKNLSWEDIRRLYKLSFRRVYLRPGYILKKFIYSIRAGSLKYMIRYFFQSRW